MKLNLYRAISAFYFFYFSILGALIPYWNLYLKESGYNAVQIGELFAIISLTKIISPILWSWMSDYFGHIMRIVRISSFISFVCFCFVFISDSYWSIAWTILAFSFFWNATLPQFEANTFDHLGQKSVERYSQIRVWGSIGFILTVTIVGFVSEKIGIHVLPFVLAFLFFMLWLVSLKVTEANIDRSHIVSDGFWEKIKQKQVVILLLIIFLSQLSHGAYYSFFSIFLEENGYGKSIIGVLWSLSVVAEVLVFLTMSHFIEKYSVHGLLGISLILTSLRWLLIAYFINYPVVIIIAQILHAASFGVFHVLMVFIITTYFSPKHKSLGQALYVSIGFGAGGALGSVLAGETWDTWGGEMVFLLFSLFSTMAIWLFYQFADYKKI